MQHYGLIGYPLSHSFSPGYFAGKFEQLGLAASYDLFPIENIADFPKLIAQHPDLCGLNVTIPHKRSILPYLDEVVGAAREIGAVNTIQFEEGRLIGYNTDVVGFRTSLLALIGEARPAALVLGTGGAAQAVQYVLRQLECPYTLVSRTRTREAMSYTDLTTAHLQAHHLVINTTPLGTYPVVDAAPDIPYDALTPEHFLFDLVYNPAETQFMQRGRAQGAQVCNGYEMLAGQAEAAWDVWQSV